MLHLRSFLEHCCQVKRSSRKMGVVHFAEALITVPLFLYKCILQYVVATVRWAQNVSY